MKNQQMISRSNYKIFIGIDPGVNTGVCVWLKDKRKILTLSTVKIHRAMQIVNNYHKPTPLDLFVRVEDARQRKWFGINSREKQQGAGSIKRDSKIWEDFLNDLGVAFEMVAPKNNKTKLTAETFGRITGYRGKTNEHNRDAAMLIYGM